jgi:hypothetical protein
MNETNPENQGQPLESEHELPQAEHRDREEILDSLLEQTKSHLDSDSLHEKLTTYVRDNRLPSAFSFENVCELVRCVLQSTNIDQLSLDFEDCVNWIAACLYDDPLANERLERLWSSIVGKIQG